MGIHYDSVSAQDLEPILLDIEDACNGHKKTHAVLACLFMAFMIQDPDISPADLQKNVTHVSEIIALLVSQKGDKRTH